MDIDKYDITILGNDVTIHSERVFYATNCHKKLRGLQCDFMSDSDEYNKILSICENIHNELIILNRLSKR